MQGAALERHTGGSMEPNGSHLLQDLLGDLVHAVRSFRRKPGYWLALLLTLSMGMALATVVFAFADAYLLRPLPYPQPRRLVAIYDSPTPSDRGAVSFPEFLEWRETFKQVAPLAAYLATSASWFDGSSVQRPHVMMASRGYMRLLGIRLVAGRGFEDRDHADGAAPVVIVSEAFWKNHLGGDPSVIGTGIELDGAVHSIVGVAVSGKDMGDGSVDIWMPLEANAEWRTPGAHYLSVIGRLEPGVTLAGAQAEMDARPRTDSSYGSATAVPLQEALAGKTAGPLRLLILGALCVLFVSLTNAAGLVYARVEAGKADLAMRRALGAQAGRLARQAVTEFALLGVVAALVSALLAWMGTVLVQGAWEQRYQNVLEAGMDIRTAVVLAGLLVVSTVILTLPVLWQVRTSELLVGSSGKRVVGTRQGMWMGIVWTQVALTTVLLVGGGLSGRSLLQLMRVDPGYDPQDVYTSVVVLPREIYRTPFAQLEALNQLLSQLHASRSVTAAGGAVNLPLSGGTMTSTFDLEGDSRSAYDQDHTMAEQHIITPGYLETMGMHLLDGRNLTPEDRAGAPRVVLINESMARRYWPGESALGRRIRILGSEFQTIVGVVADTRLDGLDRPTRLETYTPFAQVPVYYLSVVFRVPGGLRQAEQTLALARRDVDPHIPLGSVRPVEDYLDQATQGRRIPATAFGLFSTLALILAGIGLFGLQAFAVAQRQTEIGVRVALGASRLAIVRMIGGVSLTIVAGGVFVGLLLAAALGRVVASQLFGISAYDPTTYISVVVVVFLAAASATVVPAIRALRLDPLEALRAE